MLIFTCLTLLGLQHLCFNALEKYEPMIVGGVLCRLGLLIVLFEK
jgi:hypothetical protein